MKKREKWAGDQFGTSDSVVAAVQKITFTTISPHHSMIIRIFGAPYKELSFVPSLLQIHSN